eukprot:gene21349-28285_t
MQSSNLIARTPLHRATASRARPFSSFSSRPLKAIASASTDSTTSAKSEVETQHASSTFQPGLFSASMLAVSSVALLAAEPSMASVVADIASDNATVEIAKTLQTILGPVFTLFTLLYIVRIPMTWYPKGKLDVDSLPWAIAYIPTEPFLKVSRKVIPQVAGVDVSPIVWVCSISFLNEILLGPQGILVLIQRSVSILRI